MSDSPMWDCLLDSSHMYNVCVRPILTVLCGTSRDCPSDSTPSHHTCQSYVSVPSYSPMCDITGLSIGLHTIPSILCVRPSHPTVLTGLSTPSHQGRHMCRSYVYASYLSTTCMCQPYNVLASILLCRTFVGLHRCLSQPM